MLTIISLFAIETSNYTESSGDKRRFQLNNYIRITSKYKVIIWTVDYLHCEVGF